MDKLLHALALLAATLSHVHLGMTNDRQYDAGLATYGGVSAWWGETDTPGVAHLVVRSRQGKVKALPPVLSRFAPTVDVGRAPSGEPLITYAQCARTIASCRPYFYSLRDNEQVPLHLGDGHAVAVAIDGDQIAWFRETREDGPSQLLVGRTSPFGVAHPRRIRLQKIGGEPVAQPIALDLRGGRLAYSAWQGGDDIRLAVLRAGTPGRMIDVADDAGGGEECMRAEASPTITPTTLIWLRSWFGTSTCGRPVATLQRRRWADGALSHAAVSVQVAKEAVVSGGRVLVLAPRHPGRDPDDRSSCFPGDMMDEGARIPGCEARLVRAPVWLPGRGS